MKLKINPENEKYRQLAIDLSIANGTQFSANEIIYTQDIIALKQLVKHDKNTIPEIAKMINWYKHNLGGFSVPKIENADELRKKYHLLIAAKNRNNLESKQGILFPPANPTHESLNLFPKEDVDIWVQYYSDFVDQLTRANIWKINYTPNKDLIFPKLLAQKNWLNNLIEIDGFGRVSAVIGHLRLLVKEFIDYTYWELNKENAWLDGITEAHLIPNGNFFKEFIRDAGNSMTALDGGIKIRSRGWGDDEGKKIETPAEIMLRKKKEREEDKKRERKYAKQEKEKTENIQLMFECMKKYLSDIDKIDIKMLDLSKWFNDLNEKDFKDFVIEVEKRHQVNPGNRGYGYIPLWRKGLKNIYAKSH